jgi:hypothetical protein
MLSFLTGLRARVLGALAGIGLFLAFIVASFAAGRNSATTDERLEDAEEALETMEAVHEVTHSPDRDAAIGRLRDNGIIR